MRRKDDEKQQRIKEAVMRLILEEGFAGTSISKIAREAGVSPATVYIYYENKEQMLREIYAEYSEDVFSYLVARARPDMSTENLIATLVRSYYHYIKENEEIYSFVEQFSHCPALTCKCSGRRDICSIFSMIDLLKSRGDIRNYSDESLAAMIFYPVKAVAMDERISGEIQELRLQEIIELVMHALLI